MNRKKGNIIGLINPEDLPIVMSHHWHIDGQGYVATNAVHEDGRRTTLKLHRLIMKTPKGKVTDHINGDKTDNRRSNLRICTDGQNCQNTLGKITRKESKFKGVRTRNGRWEGRITANYKTHYLGLFDTEELAHEAVRVKALEIHGEFSSYRRTDANQE